MPRHGSRRTRLLAASILSALLLVGCSGGSDSGATTGSLDSAADSGGEAIAAAAPAPQAAAPPAEVRTAVLQEPSIVRTGELAVAVDDLVAAAGTAGRLARAAGGRVDSDERSRDDGDASAVLVLRLPNRSFDATLQQLAALGDERSRNLASEDVTDAVVDLDARLATQQASVQRVRALLGQAKTVGEVVQVEGELTKRTAELESLEARLAAVQGRVSLGSLTLRLTGTSTAAAATDRLGFGDGLAGGWDALTGIARAVAVAAGVLLPFTPLVAVVGAVWWLRRRSAA